MIPRKADMRIIQDFSFDHHKTPSVCTANSAPMHSAIFAVSISNHWTHLFLYHNPRVALRLMRICGTKSAFVCYTIINRMTGFSVSCSLNPALMARQKSSAWIVYFVNSSAEAKDREKSNRMDAITGFRITSTKKSCTSGNLEQVSFTPIT